ncbi:unnamed protein product, partial [Amoebophrya sp. A25]
AESDFLPSIQPLAVSPLSFPTTTSELHLQSKNHGISASTPSPRQHHERTLSRVLKKPFRVAANLFGSHEVSSAQPHVLSGSSSVSEKLLLLIGQHATRNESQGRIEVGSEQAKPREQVAGSCTTWNNFHLPQRDSCAGLADHTSGEPPRTVSSDLPVSQPHGLPSEGTTVEAWRTRVLINDSMLISNFSTINYHSQQHQRDPATSLAELLQLLYMGQRLELCAENWDPCEVPNGACIRSFCDTTGQYSASSSTYSMEGGIESCGAGGAGSFFSRGKAGTSESREWDNLMQQIANKTLPKQQWTELMKEKEVLHSGRLRVQTLRRHRSWRHPI